MNQEEIIRVRFRITGLVQGVNFRSATRREAERLGLVGFVRNNPDGSVTVVAEGGQTMIETLSRFVRGNPSRSRVEHVETEAVPIAGEKEFLVVR
jgi:acylphosphatase